MAALLAMHGAAARPSAASELLSIETAPAGAANAVILNVSAAPEHWDRFALESPPRIVIDLHGTAVKNSLHLPQSTGLAPSAPIRDIRVGRHAGPRTRIVLDLTEGSDARSIVRSVKLRLEEAEGSQRLVARFPSPPPAVAAQRRAVPTAPPEKTVASDPTPAGPVASASGGMEAAGGSLVFGSARTTTAATPPRQAPREDPTQDPRLFVERALIETGFPGDGRGYRGANTHTQFIAGLESAAGGAWSARLSARIDGQYQAGDLADLEWLRGDYDESWLRFEAAGWRLTAGAQRIIWGRVDEFSPTDRLSTRDFTRLIFDDLSLRRRANPALRAEWSGTRSNLDLVILPRFREAELPADESVWFPFDATSGSVAGLPLGDLPRQFLRGAAVNNDFDGSEGFGLRFSEATARLDYALTLQRVNNPEPYFTLGRPPTATQSAVLDVVYPRTWVAGGDVGFAWGAVTLRGEVAWLSDSLFTDAQTLMTGKSEELNWVLGAEFFPGDGDLRVTAQLSGRHLLDADGALDFTDITTFLGDLESPLRIGALPMNARLRYSFRLDERASYLNPELAYTGFEPSVIYVGAHLFNGSYGTLEGFYEDRDQVVLGWRARF
jgi:hypothetical protein